MKRGTLYNDFYCPIELMATNRQLVEDFNKSYASLGEKAFVRYILTRPDVYRISTEIPINILIKNESCTCRCDFEVEFTDKTIRYVEVNGDDHFLGRTDQTYEQFQNRQYKFVRKQLQMLTNKQFVLNINILTSWKASSTGWVDPARKEAYNKAVNNYIYDSEFAKAIDYLKSPKLNKHINYNITFNDVLFVKKSNIKFADDYMQNMLNYWSYKYIVELYKNE